MPYWTEHGTLGGIIYFVLLQASLAVVGISLTMSWVVWAILLWGFCVGAYPDARAIKTNGTWKFWTWKRDAEMYYRTHYGDIATWFFKRWWQIWTLPAILHILIDRGFHKAMSVDKNEVWWFGEWLHLIVNAFLIVSLMMMENAI